MMLGKNETNGSRSSLSHHMTLLQSAPICAAASALRSPSARRRRRRCAPKLSPWIAQTSGFKAFSRSGTGSRQKATQLCRCGLGGQGRGACGKAPRCQLDYQGRISGPLFDRIDLQVEVPPVTAADLALPPPAEGTAEAAARVTQAREAQATRAADAGLPDEAALNATASGAALEKIAAPDEPGRQLLSKAAELGGLTARGWTRTLRLARTIADLEGSTGVLRRHIAEALIHRRTALDPSRPAEKALAPTR